MADVSWPNDVPKSPLVDSFTEQPGRDVVRTQMDAGPSKMRRRTTAGVRKITKTLRMTESEVESLDTFYTSTLGQGTLRFDVENPRTGTVKEMRFVKRPTWRLVTDDDYDVNVQLEVMP